MAHENVSTPAAPGVPGVPAGNPPAQPVATLPVPNAPGGSPAAAVAPAKKPFGGNVGKKTRADGFKPGSPEALAADRERDAKRKRDERAAKAAATPPPPLPASAAPLGTSVSDQAAPPGDDAFMPVADPVLLWTPADFNDCARELVELAEEWRISERTKQAVNGKLPARVVKEIAGDAAFPPGSKRSLSNSSPATLARMFNALRVPVSLKSVITVAPALAYIIVRDLKTGQRIDQLIADEEEKRKTETPPAGQSQPPPK